MIPRADSRALLRAMFDAAVDSALPAHCVPPHLPPAPKGRTVVVGAGKAAAAMARAVEDHWPGPLEGVVVTRYGHAVPCHSVTVIEAAHPVPDEAGIAAARSILTAVDGLSADDLVIALVSGGGSALLPALPPGVTLADERTLTEALLRSGAPIAEINCVRRHVSLLKGGRLAEAALPAPVWTIVISDVPGDDPAAVASGPTVPDRSSPRDAIAILDRHAITAPPSIARWLADSAAERERPGAPPAGSPPVPIGEVRVAASAGTMLDAARKVASAAGYSAVVLGDAIEGEAREVGRQHADIARASRAQGTPAAAPCVILSGGETTVRIAGPAGRGGRNAEYLLGLLLALDGAPGIAALAADTDGIDGSEDNAGAIIDDRSLARARSEGLDPGAYLDGHDAYSFFGSLGDLVTTGPTLTNVNDFRAIVIDRLPASQEPATR